MIHTDYEAVSMAMKKCDQMQKAMECGRGYQTWLDPPPADESVAHEIN